MRPTEKRRPPGAVHGRFARGREFERGNIWRPGIPGDAFAESRLPRRGAAEHSDGRSAYSLWRPAERRCDAAHAGGRVSGTYCRGKLRAWTPLWRCAMSEAKG